MPGRLGCWTLNSISQSAPALTRRRDGVTVEAPLDCHGPIAPTGCVPRAASAAIVCHGNCQGGAPRWAKTPIVLPRLCLLINSLVASLNHLPLGIPHASKTCAETVRPRCCAARSRVPPSNVENAARVGASLHDGPRSRCHSAVRLVWRARSAGLGQRHCPGVAAVEDRILSRGTRRSRLLGKEVGGELRARRFAQGSTTPFRRPISKSSAVLPQTIIHVLNAAAAPS